MPQTIIDRDVLTSMHQSEVDALRDTAQAYLDEMNATDPADYDPMPLQALFRHPCKKARQSHGLAGKGVSTAIDLKERYVPMTEVAENRGVTFPSTSTGERVALVYREGKCKKCGQTARSSRARLVLTSSRPPVSGRVGRE
jgi:hypothetical protein